MRVLTAVAVAVALVAPVAGAQHAHGVGALEVAVEGRTAQVRVSVPTDDIYGFERAPRTDAERARRDAALKSFAERGSELLLFDAALGCVITSTRVSDDVDPNAPGHREVVAEYAVRCQRDLAKSRLRLGVATVFPKVTQMKATRVSDDGATTKTLRRGDFLEL